MCKYLTDKEIKTILSKNVYWQEVAQRDDKRPLRHELRDLVAELGTKLLGIVAEYAEQRELINAAMESDKEVSINDVSLIEPFLEWTTVEELPPSHKDPLLLLDKFGSLHLGYFLPIDGGTWKIDGMATWDYCTHWAIIPMPKRMKAYDNF
jgi:hypothetical protein